jgi:adenylate kinase family enzyme
VARVYVVGGGGSGKSTLGAVLARRLGCPLVRLDAVFGRPAAVPGQAVVGRAEGDALLRALTAPDAWVLEGNFPGWIAEAAARAAVVAWLDVPFPVAAWRIVRRHVAADLRGENPYSGYRRLWRFLHNQRRYYADTPAAYRRRLAADPDRWRGALYGRAAVAAHAAGMDDRLLRVTGGDGDAQAIAAAVLRRLAAAPGRAV